MGVNVCSVEFTIYTQLSCDYTIHIICVNPGVPFSLSGLDKIIRGHLDNMMMCNFIQIKHFLQDTDWCSDIMSQNIVYNLTD